MVGEALLVKTTSLADVPQPPFVIVQRKVALCSSAKPVTDEVGLVGVVMFAPLAAPIIVQRPVPTEGVFPAKVNEPLLHFC